MKETESDSSKQKLSLVEWMCKHKVSALHMPLPMAIAKAIDFQEK